MLPASGKYRGINARHLSGKQLSYQAQVKGPDGVRYNLGSFAGAVEAAVAYDLAALALRGRESTITNFPPDTYSDQQVLDALKNLKKPAKIFKSSRFRGVCTGKGTRWRSHVRINGTQVALGTFDTEEEAAIQYDLAQLYLHSCDLPAAAHKLNMDCWGEFRLQQLQQLTAGAGSLITASLLEHSQPSDKQQQHKQQTMHKMQDVPAAHAGLTDAAPVSNNITSQQQQEPGNKAATTAAAAAKVHIAGTRVKALQKLQKLPAFAAAAAALAAARHQVQLAREARATASGAAKPERKAAKQTLKAAKQKLKDAKRAVAAAQEDLQANRAASADRQGGEYQQQQGTRQPGKKRTRGATGAADAGGSTGCGDGLAGASAAGARGLTALGHAASITSKQQLATKRAREETGTAAAGGETSSGDGLAGAAGLEAGDHAAFIASKQQGNFEEQQPPVQPQPMHLLLQPAQQSGAGGVASTVLDLQELQPQDSLSGERSRKQQQWEKPKQRQEGWARGGGQKQKQQKCVVTQAQKQLAKRITSEPVVALTPRPVGDVAASIETDRVEGCAFPPLNKETSASALGSGGVSKATDHHGRSAGDVTRQGLFAKVVAVAPDSSSSRGSELAVKQCSGPAAAGGAGAGGAFSTQAGGGYERLNLVLQLRQRSCSKRPRW
jgi:hypothetical protein